MVVFSIPIFLFLGSMESFSTKSQPCTYSKDKACKPALANALFSTVAFELGAITSVVSGFLRMKIATYANARITLEARKGVGKAFIVAFQSGTVMGFLLAANGLLVLYIAINLFNLYYCDDWEGLFESITGYGLGGSSMAPFGRVGGGIYTKAGDVGANYQLRFGGEWRVILRLAMGVLELPGFWELKNGFFLKSSRRCG